MAAAWPETLPQRQELNISIAPRDYSIKSPTDIGPVKVRNRYVQDELTLDVVIPLTLTGAQMQAMLDFLLVIANQAGDECLVFSWEHPVTDNACLYRLKQYPIFSCARGGTPGDTGEEDAPIPAGNRRVWRGQLDLEIVEIAD